MVSHSSPTLYSTTTIGSQDIEKQSVTERTYLGSGTPTDPYIVDWDLNDPEDPYNWSKTKKWAITMQVCSLFLSSILPSNAVLSWLYVPGPSPLVVRHTLAV